MAMSIRSVSPGMIRSASSTWSAFARVFRLAFQDHLFRRFHLSPERMLGWLMISLPVPASVRIPATATAAAIVILFLFILASRSYWWCQLAPFLFITWPPSAGSPLFACWWLDSPVSVVCAAVSGRSAWNAITTWTLTHNLLHYRLSQPESKACCEKIVVSKPTVKTNPNVGYHSDYFVIHKECSLKFLINNPEDLRKCSTL